MMIRFAPTYSRFVKVLKLWRKVNSRSQLRYVLFMWVAPAAALLSLMNDVVTYIVMPRFTHVINTPGGVISDIAVLLICGLCPFLELYNRKIAYQKHLSRMPSYIIDGEFHFSISSEGLELQSNGRESPITHPWDFYGSLIQNGNMVLLLSADKKEFEYFPRDAFTSDEFTEFSAILERHLRKGPTS